MNSTACERSSVEELGRDCCIRDYHVYKEMWEAAAGEVLECVRGLHNVQGRYAVTAKKIGNNHWTFTTKVVEGVFVLLATRGHDILYSDWGEKILRRSVYHIELSCTVTGTTRLCTKAHLLFCTVNYCCFNYCQ